MSEEVKEQQENQEPVEEKKEEAAEAVETKEQAPASEESASAPKVKKINRLSLDQLNTKISEMESKNLQKSIYYKHLVERKKEVEGYPAPAAE